MVILLKISINNGQMDRRMGGWVDGWKIDRQMDG